MANSNSNSNSIQYQKYKITYKIVDGNNLYLEFIENEKVNPSQYSKIFTQKDIDDMQPTIFTNAESFFNTLKRTFTENASSFELKKIKRDKENNQLIITLKIIVLEIDIILPKKSSYQHLDERILYLESQNLELKQRLSILEKFISTHLNSNSNSNYRLSTSTTTTPSSPSLPPIPLSLSLSSPTSPSSSSSSSLSP